MSPSFESFSFEGANPSEGFYEYYESREHTEWILSEKSMGWEDVSDFVGNELLRRRTEDLSSLSPQDQQKIIEDSARIVLPRKDLRHKLFESSQNDTPLNIKYGIDPTGADVHLGHAVPILLLDRLQRMGHDVTFIVGDFTAKVGDPTGKVASRPVLSDEQITKNMLSYADQVRPLINLDAVKVVYNSEWLNDYPMKDLVRVLGKVSVASILQRDDFRNRLEQGSGLTQAELVYPVLMGLDSAYLRTDIEVGGVDQLLNMQTCRTVMKSYGLEPEIIAVTDLIEGIGTGNEKMSKSSGNYIGLSENPEEIYGKVMSIPDSRMKRYFSMLTELSQPEWQLLEEKMASGLNPMLVKKLLAKDITALLHGADVANTAAKDFDAKFSSSKKLNTFWNLVESSDEQFEVPNRREDILSLLAQTRGVSGSRIRQMLKEGAVSLSLPDGSVTRADNLQRLQTLLTSFTGNAVLKVGKKHYRINRPPEDGPFPGEKND